MPPLHTLTVPLDASQIDDVKAGQKIKVGVQLQDGSVQSDVVKLSASKTGTATLKFKSRPGSVRVAIGPADASDDELMGLQTINVTVTPRQWRKQAKLVLPAVRITPFHWRRWLRWCRTVTVHGRVVCPDGSPVPGAEVSAFDVDWWWWWCSSQQVGTATSDENGDFTLTFRHCCYWSPGWWWRNRFWQLAPELAEQLVPVLQRELGLKRLPKPSPRPDLSIFEDLLGKGPGDPPIGRAPKLSRSLNARASLSALRAGGLTPDAKTRFDTRLLERVRERLAKRIPVVPQLERLRLWPWHRWTPWNDCSPDIIFRATQRCDGEEKVIVAENCWDTRWDVGSSLDVTLVAPDACCIEEPCPDANDCPDGECVVITQVCGAILDQIGGNPGASATPEGYYSPQHADRPFGGNVQIRGVFGNAATVDYYEFEISDDGGANHSVLPPAVAGGFTRRYWGPKLGTGDPPEFHSVPFNPQVISGRNVFESREHFEANNDPVSWTSPGQTRFWASNLSTLINLGTHNTLADGTYYFHIRSYDEVGGVLQVPGSVLPLCGTEENNGLVVRLDNRLVGPGSGHPATTPTHPVVAAGHLQTLEPDTDIVRVTIDGSLVEACDIVDASSSGTLSIRFLASDPDDHLAYYRLRATFGENQLVDLLTLPSAVLTPVGGSIPGPTYQEAVTPPGPGKATRPYWGGGEYVLSVDVAEAFTVSCAYQLELEAAKRTIVSCNYGSSQRNWSHYSFTVQV